MIQDVLKEKKAWVEERLAALLTADEPAHRTLYEAMNYSLLAGGKRIRPILFLLGLGALGLPSRPYIDAACAVECVHTYSLIHDDLPQMDNDDYRRGRLTNHKVYGAGMATMAGDGLLTFAFTLLAGMETVPAEIRCGWIRILGEAAGPSGMVGGQAQDIESAGKPLSEEELALLDRCKTGCLLTAPLDMAALLASAGTEDRVCLHAYGMHLGLLFQITDDILDAAGDLAEMGKTPGQDAALHKSTWVTALGLAAAREKAAEEAEKAVRAAAPLQDRAAPLQELARMLVKRTK